jgi:hypothetical protein
MLFIAMGDAFFFFKWRRTAGRVPATYQGICNNKEYVMIWLASNVDFFRRSRRLPGASRQLHEEGHSNSHGQ